jgi:hypothetical protein
MMFKRQKTWWFVVGALLVLLLTLNFLSFRAARSSTETNHSFSTYRTGETMPDSMTPGFTLSYSVTGEDRLAEALSTALQAELEAQTSVGAVTITPPDPERSTQDPLLLVDLVSDRLWTPFYGHTTLNARIYYAYDGDAPWPLDEPVVFRGSPAVKADGEFTLVDTTWGLISKPAYTQHLAQALAEAVADALQNEVFSR